MEKTKWVRLAQALDALRILPRVIIITLIILYCVVVWDMWSWTKVVDASKYSDIQLAAVLGIPSLLLGGIGGMITGIFKMYLSTGIDWGRTEYDEPEKCDKCGRKYEDN